MESQIEKKCVCGHSRRVHTAGNAACTEKNCACETWRERIDTLTGVYNLGSARRNRSPPDFDGTSVDRNRSPVRDQIHVILKPDPAPRVMHIPDALKRWYESKRQGLGEEFLLAVEHALDSVLENPKMYPVLRRDIRRNLLHRFPYSLFYRVVREQVVVVACFHAKRDPKQFFFAARLFIGGEAQSSDPIGRRALPEYSSQRGKRLPAT